MFYDQIIRFTSGTFGYKKISWPNIPIHQYFLFFATFWLILIKFDWIFTEFDWSRLKLTEYWVQIPKNIIISSSILNCVTDWSQLLNELGLKSAFKLQLFSCNLKAMLPYSCFLPMYTDGWKERFWVPVLWGWLPNKSEENYKVFLLFTFTWNQNTESSQGRRSLNLIGQVL